jgi:hypothetical protein
LQILASPTKLAHIPFLIRLLPARLAIEALQWVHPSQCHPLLIQECETRQFGLVRLIDVGSRRSGCYFLVWYFHSSPCPANPARLAKNLFLVREFGLHDD